jgi:hypothetical protein
MKRIRWAKAVYCAGVDSWYVRIGGRHGIDPMFKCHNETNAKTMAGSINMTLTRLVNRRKTQ